MSLETDVVSLVGDPAKALITQASRIEHQANALLEGLERAGLAVDDALSRLRADVGARDGRSAKSSVVRVEIDPANANSLRLLAALSHHEGVQRDTSLMAPLARRLSSEIASTVKAASASRGKVKFFFARGKTKEKATSSLASLQQLLAWSAKNGIERHLQLAITRCEPPSWDGMQLYGDFQARPGSYYDAVAKAMGANPAQVEAEAFVDADIVRSAVVLAHLASRLIGAFVEAPERVRPAFLALRNQMVRRDLAQMPIARLKDATDGRLRFGVIESAGYTSVLDIVNTSVPVLQAINGVGPQTAMQVHVAARQVAKAVEDDLNFRVDLDPGNKLSTTLLKELYLWDRLHRGVTGMEEDLERVARELAPLARISAPTQGQVGFFTGGSTGGNLKTSTVRGWVNWALGNDARLKQAGSALSPQAVNAEDAWSDFERRSAEYYVLLGELVDLKLDVAATEGYLPAEIVAQVHQQPLDDTFSRVSLRGYQSFGARFALVQKRVIIGDEMGLGKTIQAIAAMAHLRATGATKFLVVCPASVLINWTREIADRSILHSYRLHGLERAANLKAWNRNGGVGVTTFEALRVIGISRDVTLAMLVVDEAHFVKNPDAQRSQSVARIIKQAERIMFMTGTPMENRVEEFKSLVAYLQPDLIPQIGGAQAIVGASAFRKSVAPVYLRRNQEDVLAELPPLVQVDEWEEFGSADFTAYRIAVQAGNFMAMRRAAFATSDPKRSAKLTRLVEIADEAGDNGHKVIVFSYFRDVLANVQLALGTRAIGPLNGGVPPAQRQQLVDVFSAAKGHSVLVSQIQAGGVGLNMQAGSVVILCEPQVKPTLEAQAIGRAYRMGQVRSVQVHRLLIEDSVDQRMLEILDSKSRLFDEYARPSAIADSSPEAIDISEASLAKAVVEREQERLAMKMMSTAVSEPQNDADAGIVQ